MDDLLMQIHETCHDYLEAGGERVDLALVSASLKGRVVFELCEEWGYPPPVAEPAWVQWAPCADVGSIILRFQPDAECGCLFRVCQLDQLEKIRST